MSTTPEAWESIQADGLVPHEFARSAEAGEGKAQFLADVGGGPGVCFRAWPSYSPTAMARRYWTTTRVVVTVVVAVLAIIVVLALIGALTGERSTGDRALYEQCLVEQGRQPGEPLPLTDNVRRYCGLLARYPIGKEPSPIGAEP